jgi:hypothetical protein
LRTRFVCGESKSRYNLSKMSSMEAAFGSR